MAPVVYMLGTLVTLACAILLLRGYIRGRKRLLLWSGLCFLGLAASNLLVFVDLVILPDVDLYVWRLLSAAIAMMLLLFGLIWEGE
jgi:hypothetical protein